MKGLINKKIVAIIAITALISIFAVSFVACNDNTDNNPILTKEEYTKLMEDKGYNVVAMNEEQLKSALGNTNVTAEWGIIASLTSGSTSESEMQFVSIVKLKNDEDAKVVEEEVKKVADKGFSIVRNGSILLVGSDKAVADAKN